MNSYIRFASACFMAIGISSVAYAEGPAFSQRMASPRAPDVGAEVIEVQKALSAAYNKATDVQRIATPEVKDHLTKAKELMTQADRELMNAGIAARKK